MKAIIFDYKRMDDNKSWALCKCNLRDYLYSLKEDFFEFSVQRKIVNNVYLDTIYDAIVTGEPIPSVTLCYYDELENKDGECELDGNRIEILDGLQRTYRLWIVLKINDLIKKHKCTNFKELASVMQKDDYGRIVMQNSFVTPKFLRMLLEQKGGKPYSESILDGYSNYDLYFNVWTGLSDEDIVRKMLVLNAGQKSVSSIHQYELMFLHFFEKQSLNYNKDIELIREREANFREVQSGMRKRHQYLMSSVIVALQSFIHGKYMKVASVNSINIDDNNIMSEEILSKYFNANTLSEFINQLDKFGERLINDNGAYLKWYGKDTVLSGIFGAIGEYCKQNYETRDIESLCDCVEVITKEDDPFKINTYYHAYETKAGTSNLGNVVRKAVFYYTKSLLESGSSDWDKNFEKSSNYDKK